MRSHPSESDHSHVHAAFRPSLCNAQKGSSRSVRRWCTRWRCTRLTSSTAARKGSSHSSPATRARSRWRSGSRSTPRWQSGGRKARLRSCQGWVVAGGFWGSGPSLCVRLQGCCHFQTMRCFWLHVAKWLASLSPCQCNFVGHFPLGFPSEQTRATSVLRCSTMRRSYFIVCCDAASDSPVEIFSSWTSIEETFQ